MNRGKPDASCKLIFPVTPPERSKRRAKQAEARAQRIFSARPTVAQRREPAEGRQGGLPDTNEKSPPHQRGFFLIDLAFELYITPKDSSA